MIGIGNNYGAQYAQNMQFGNTYANPLPQEKVAKGHSLSIQPYVSREKNDTGIKVAALGTAAVTAGALVVLAKGKGKDGKKFFDLFKSASKKTASSNGEFSAKSNFTKSEIRTRAKSIAKARKARIEAEALEAKKAQKVQVEAESIVNKSNFTKSEIKTRAKSIAKARKARIANEEAAAKEAAKTKKVNNRSLIERIFGLNKVEKPESTVKSYEKYANFTKSEVKTRAKSIAKVRKARIEAEALEAKKAQKVQVEAEKAQKTQVEAESIANKSNFTKSEIKSRAKSIAKARKARIEAEALEAKKAQKVQVEAEKAQKTQVEAESIANKSNFTKSEIKSRAKSIAKVRKARIASENAVVKEAATTQETMPVKREGTLTTRIIDRIKNNPIVKLFTIEKKKPSADIISNPFNKSGFEKAQEIEEAFHSLHLTPLDRKYNISKFYKKQENLDLAKTSAQKENDMKIGFEKMEEQNRLNPKLSTADEIELDDNALQWLTTRH